MGCLFHLFLVLLLLFFVVLCFVFWGGIKFISCIFTTCKIPLYHCSPIPNKLI